MKTFIIAECGVNHEGDLKRAIKMGKEAAKAGADAIKFQAYHAEDVWDDPEKIKVRKKFELSLMDYSKLVKSVPGVPVFFSVFSDEYTWMRYLPFYKLASRQFSEENLKRYNRYGTIASVPKSVIANHMTLTVINTFRNIAYLYCDDSYPAEKPDLHNIEIIRGFNNRGPVGYSCHAMGADYCIEAVKKHRVHIIEKHFTLDHDQSDFIDHKHALAFTK